MKKTLLFLLSALLMQSVYAIQAYPVKKTVKTVGGETITVTLRGDEHFSYYTAEDGSKFKKLPTGLFEKYTEAELIDVMQDVQARRDEATARQLSARSTRGATVGTRKGLVILANFTDVKFTVGTNAIFNNFFNKPGFSDYGMAGSVHDYFLDQSYGKFDLTFDVVGPVPLPQSMAYYGRQEGKTHDVNAKQFAVDAIQAAAPQVDYSKYDWDGDGTVDQVFIVFAGYNQAEGGPDDTIWPHEWSIGEYRLEYNGVKLSTYGCSSEFKGASGANLCGIGTACHEFSHCLGLPDTYDTGTSGNFGMGNWDLMSSGNYLGNSCCPMGYTAYERWVSGWLSPVEIDKECSVSGMKAIEEEPEAYVLYNDATHDEFYILQNRQNQKWGKDINAHGLFVEHIDYDRYVWAYNQVNNETGRERVTFIPADGIKMASNYDGDTYPGSKNKTALTDTSSPAANVYNENADGTLLMGKPITNISESLSGLISFEAMKGVVVGPENLEATDKTTDSFKLAWKAIEGAKQYELIITEIPGLKENPFEAFLLEEDFATSCYAKSVNTLNKINGSLDRYTASSKGWSATNVFKGPKGLQLASKTAGGTLKSPDVQSPYYGLTTATLIASPATAGQTVSFKINLYIGGSKYGAYSLSVSEEENIVLSVPETTETVAFEIETTDPLNVSYFSVHEGDFDSADFDKYDESGAHSYAEGITSATKTAETNSYLFDGAKSGNIYKCRVRAVLDGEGQYSKWSTVIIVDMSSTSLDTIRENAIREDSWYDLNGNKVTDNTKPGLYINNNGKAVMVL